MFRYLNPLIPCVRSFSRGAPQESDDFVEADDCIDSDSVSMPCSGNVNEENDSVSPDNEDDKVLKVVSVQNFDGSFQFAPILASLLKSTIEELKTSTAILFQIIFLFN